MTMPALIACGPHAAGLALLVEELRRLVRSPLLIITPLVFLVLNGALIFGNSWLFPHMAEVDAVVRQAGVHMGEEFLNAVEERPASYARDQLAFSLSHVDDTIARLDANMVADVAANAMDTPLAARMMASKYAAWEQRAKDVRALGQERDVYGGSYTFDLHQFLFDTLVPVVIVEASAIGVAALLYMGELDERTGARLIVLSSFVGRRVVVIRFFASLIGALAAYAALSMLTFGAVALLSGWGFGPAWASSVSSVFNVAVEGGFALPFVTWVDCSVGTYLMMSLLLGLGFVTLFCLMVQAALLAGGYNAVRAAATALAFAIAPLGMQAVCALNGWRTVRVLLHLFPAPLLAVSGQWFTDLGFCSFAPWQEVVAVAGGIAVLWCMCLVLRRAWFRGDMA